MIIGLLEWLNGKEITYNAGDTGNIVSILGLGRSPGVGNGNALQDSCWEHPRDSGGWPATVCRVAKSQTQLSDRAATAAVNVIIIINLKSDPKLPCIRRFSPTSKHTENLSFSPVAYQVPHPFLFFTPILCSPLSTLQKTEEEGKHTNLQIYKSKYLGSLERKYLFVS